MGFFRRGGGSANFIFMSVGIFSSSICGLVFSQCRTTVALLPWKGQKRALQQPLLFLLGGGCSTSSWPCLYHKMVTRYSGCSSYSVALSRYTARLRFQILPGFSGYQNAVPAKVWALFGNVERAPGKFLDWQRRKSVHDHHQKRIFRGTFLASKKNFPGRWSIQKPCKNHENHIYHRNLSSVAPIFSAKKSSSLEQRGVCFLFPRLARNSGM